MSMTSLPQRTDAYQHLDAALACGQAYSQIRGRGRFTNHSTTAAEALAALGLPEAAQGLLGSDGRAGWYNRYAELEPTPSSEGRQITRSNFREFIGDHDALGALNEFLGREFRSATSWRGAINVWAAHLVGDPTADLFHGIIQVGHAIRALEVADTPVRRTELARGFSLWASRHQNLPVRSSALAATVSDRDAVVGMPRIQVGDLSLAEQVRAAAFDPTVAGITASIRTSGIPEVALFGLALVMAQQFNALGSAPEGARHLILLHTVTGADAATRLLPYLDSHLQQRLVDGMFVGSMAITAIHGPRAIAQNPMYRIPTISQLRELAADGREAHVAKAIAAGVTLNTTTGHRAFLDFALHATRAVDPALSDGVAQAFALPRSASVEPLGRAITRS